jgi:hypothetical protein
MSALCIIRVVALAGCALRAPLFACVVGGGPARPVNVAANAVALDADTQGGTYGNPAAAAPFWRLQHSSDCGEMAVADVVGKMTGKEPTERQITALARKTAGVTGAAPIYRRRTGTDVRNLPVLLARYGIQSSLDHTSIDAVEHDLAEGHKVIAAVNAASLWNIRGERDVDDHVVVVTGIDPQAGAVHLNDSGIETGRDERVSLTTFQKTWATSHDLAVVTN